MPSINENFLKLEKNYLFINIAKKVKAFTEAHPEADIIRMGIGDVTQPIAKCVVEAMKKGADEMGVKETFKGYEDSGAGYDFLKEAVAGYYKSFGVDIPVDDIRINDGAKSDCGNIVDIFGDDNVVLITDPAYPVYVDTNLMNGRKVIYADSNEENNFAAMPDENVKCDIIYLCSPNNPTGTVLSRARLAEWIKWCKDNDAILMFDSAYEAFISTEDTVKSIYEIEGAREVAIEFRSFSKTAGFTGTRCAYAVVPKEVTGKTKSGERQPLNPMWNRRQCTKFNGVPYIIQRGAEAVYTKEGREQTRANIAYYKENARIIKEGLESIGLTVYGGVDAPYIWLKTPGNMTSWELFDILLEQVQIVSTPGSGFGPHGEGYLRLTAFGSRENTIRAVERIKTLQF